METKLTKEQLSDLYSRTSEQGREVLRTLFGEEEFRKRPIGVWCLIRQLTTLKLVRRQDWEDCYQGIEIGVAVITDKTQFVIAPHNTVAAQWSPIDAGRDSVELITDTESLDAARATDRIVEKYSGALHVDSDSETQYNFIGAPAADFCRQYSHGGIGANKWHLPTVAQLKIIADNIEEVNACFLTMGLPPMVMGWYWSSIACKDDNRCAWLVYMGNGSTDYDYKYGSSYVRAVSAFQI